MNASLAYEILMYLNSFYFGMFASCELSMGLLKAINLKYENHLLLRESLLLVGLCLLELIRIALGNKGSLSDKGFQVICSALLTLPCICGVTYLILYQTYCLKLEYILCALMLAMQITELVMAIAFIFTLCRNETYT